ncbi:MAG: cobalt-precorrin 5A hydrolase, partial [Geminicoccaceae bacterium]
MSKLPAIVMLGPSGLEAARRIALALRGAELHGPCGPLDAEPGIVAYDQLAPRLRELFAAGRPIVALCASGIVIRVLAPLIEDKGSEPPVAVVAEDGSAVVPLLGGHRGANRLARAIAERLGCRPAITTAGDLRFDLALDAPPAGWRVRNPEAAKAVTSALLQGQEVRLQVEAGDAGWLLAGGAPFAAHGELELRLTERDDPGSARRLVLHPAVLALGVGCERGVAADELIGLAESMLERHGYAQDAIACVVSLDLKAAEPAVHALAARLGVPARFFAAARLEAETPRLASPSAEVFAATGCHGVAEGAALAATGPDGVLVVAKTKSARATCALARAGAPLDPERIGRPQGRLAIVG